MRTLIKPSLLLTLALLVGGCATGPAPHRPTPSDDSLARSAVTQGDHAMAAQEYLRLAELPETADALRPQYRLEAADAWLQGGHPARALLLIEGIDPLRLPAAQQLRLRLLQARTTLALRNAERTLDLLRTPLAPATAPALQADYHHLRAQAYSHLGNHLEAARELMLRGQLLADETVILENQQQLWNSLTQLSAQALRALRFAPPPDEFSGWLHLAEINKQYQLTRRELEQLLQEWRRGYPRHPARELFITGMLARSDKLLVQPKQIALLLPLSGRFAAAGAALRDGVLAAYYSQPPERRITVKVYDIADPSWVLMNYAQALRDGAEFIIGPLSKEAVATLLTRDNFPVPTLVLNSVDGDTLPDRLYQFSLAPEGEAQQVAEHAWLEGYSRAAVFTPEGEWGDRIERAFGSAWERLGGTVSSSARYDGTRNDFSRPLRTLLNLDLSDARQRRLETLLGKKLHFEPRRREDIDFVFLAAFPRQARLIRPQLKFHHAGGLPVLGTSHLYSGVRSPDLDRDMDGIVFGDMPWTLRAATSNNGLHTEVTNLRLGDDSLQRLLAMGIDSYNLIPVLGVLQAYPFERFQGETGSLRLDEQRHIQRQLSWARMQVGTPRLLQQPSGTVPAQ